MQHVAALRQTAKGFMEQMAGGRNRPPPDDLMVSCKKQLTDLRDEITIVKQQFSNYAHQVVEASEASVTLSKSVGKFYSKANHPGRTESVNTYKKVQEDIANRAVNTFHITVENGLISELSEWVQLVNNLNDKIGAAESTRITAHDTQNRLVSLQNEYQDKKSKKQGLFGSNKEQDLEGLQQKIAEASDAQKSLSSEYQKSRNNIAQQVKQLMEKRYRYFDRIYVQMLECQAEYFQHAATQSKRFQRDIDYYRKQYPKTNDFATSNGGGINGDNNIPNGDNGFPSRKRSVNSDDSKSNKKDQQISSNGNRSPRKTVPKQPAPNVQSQASTASTTTTQSSSSQSSSNPTTSTSSPVMNIKKEKSSPPIQQHTKQENHDFLAMNSQQRKPKINKQESLLGMSHLFGGGSSGNNGNNVSNNDHDDLLKLGNPDHNDLLGMNSSSNNNNYNNGNGNYNNGNGMNSGNSHIRGQHSQSTSALGNPQTSHSITQNEDDIFGDFFGASNPATPQQTGQRSSHQPTNSTLDWFENGDKPQQKKQSVSQSSQSLQQGMMAEFNKPSYGGGHGQQNGNRAKPNPPQSATSSTPLNGAQKADLSHEDKVKMVNMKLSKKGQDAADAAYKQAMDDRKKKEDEAERLLKEKEYFKNKHEQVLNNWEFDNTVRRNIRTLIGKLPDVLSLGDTKISWKPIPMTKLLNDAQLKKGYYKAVRVVHPDKSQGRGDSIENQVICDYVFQALEQAFNTKFG